MEFMLHIIPGWKDNLVVPRMISLKCRNCHHKTNSRTCTKLSTTFLPERAPGESSVEAFWYFLANVLFDSFVSVRLHFFINWSRAIPQPHAIRPVYKLWVTCFGKRLESTMDFADSHDLVLSSECAAWNYVKTSQSFCRPGLEVKTPKKL